MAVEVFFALSGFVLARQLIFCVESSSWRNLFVFYSRRWMRTLPPYLIVLIFLSIATHEVLSGDFWRYAFFIRNLITINDQGDYFTVAWSLAVEEWFYLLFPPFLIILTRMRLSILATALAFVGLLFAAKIAYLAVSPEQFEQARRIVAVRLDSIAFGFILAVLTPKLTSRRQQAFPISLTLCGLAFASSIVSFQQNFVLAFMYAAPIFAVTLISTLLHFEESFSQQPAVAKLASFGANTSYMIYLVHTLLIMKLSGLHGAVPEVVQFSVYVVLLLAICALFFITIEAPILRSRPRYSPPSALYAGSQPRRFRFATIVASNIAAVVVVSAAIEGSAGAIKWLYVEARNIGAFAMSPIDASQKTTDAMDPTSTYSSKAVARDIALNDAMPGSAYQYESYIVYRNRPFTSETVNIAADGMRKNGASDPPLGPVRNVWVFGSSPVFGMTSADRETIPANVETVLRRLLGPNVAVANFGVPGYTSLQDFLNFKLRLAELPKPELVIFFNGHNDHNLAWLARSKSCETLLQTGVGSSRILSESWEIWSHGGTIIWSAIFNKAHTVFSNTFELIRLAEKFLALHRANNDIASWRQQYRTRRDDAAAIAESCVRREQADYLRSMRLAAELATSEGIRIAFIHQPVLYTTRKPLVGVERLEAHHLNDTFFALNDHELDTLQTVPPNRIDQDQMWVKERYNATYEDQKVALRELAKHVGARFIDLDRVVDNAGEVAVFSSSIHFTFRGTRLLGDEIANNVVDMLKPAPLLHTSD